MSRGLENARVVPTKIESASVVSSMKPAMIADAVPSMKPTVVRETLEKGIDPPKAARVMNLLGDEAAAKVAKKIEPEALARMVTEARPQDKAPVKAVVFGKMRSTRRVVRVLEEVVKRDPREASRSLGAMQERAMIKMAKRMDSKALAEVVTGADPKYRAQMKELAFDRLRSKRQVAKLFREVTKLDPKEAARSLANRSDAGKLVKKIGSEALTEMVAQAGPRYGKPVGELVFGNGRLGRRVLGEVAKSNPREAAHSLVALPRDVAGKAVKKVGPEARAEIVTQARQQDRRHVSEIVFGNGRLRQRVETYQKVAEKNPRIADRGWDKIQAEVTDRLAKKLEAAKAEATKKMEETQATVHALESKTAKEAAVAAERLESAKLADAMQRMESSRVAGMALSMGDKKKVIDAFRSIKPKPLAGILEQTVRIDAKAATSLAEQIPIDALARAAKLMDPKIRNGIMEHMSSKTNAGLISQMNKIEREPAERSSFRGKLKRGTFMTATTLLVSAIDEIPIVKNQGWQVNQTVINLGLSGLGSTFIVGGGLVRFAVKPLPKWLGGKPLIESPNAYQITNATLWATIGTGLQSVVAPFLPKAKK